MYSFSFVLVNKHILTSIKILILYHTYPFTDTFILFTLITEDSLWQYIQSCCNIHYLPLILFYYFENWDKQILIWCSHCFPYCTCCPFIATVVILHQYWLPQARWQLVLRDVESKSVIICVHTHTHTHTHTHWSDRYLLLIHMQKLKRCDMHERKECITKYNVQYNTHAHTPVNTSLRQNTPTNNTHLFFTLHSPQ